MQNMFLSIEGAGLLLVWLLVVSSTCNRILCCDFALWSYITTFLKKGPIGAVIGGLAANATTGLALEGLDEHNRRKNAKKIEDSKEKSTGQSEWNDIP